MFGELHQRISDVSPRRIRALPFIRPAMPLVIVAGVTRRPRL